ncbi:MAG TPA: SDR family oxidoreductase [Oligoflexia bacterium]|nr:SDR family oxidoreductase [Oligoflexia bacterium]HMR25077.1 SDR family oxidoreductase [Oligoflexia bacterium]
MSNILSNKTVLITGASKGIGEAAAYYLAELGACVVLFARSEITLQKMSAKIPNSHFFVGDVSNSENVKQAVQLAIEKTGRLDVLINNAGIIDPIAKIVDSNVEAWSKVIDVNVKGVYYALKYAIPYLLKNKGTVINISSGAARSALEGWSHYCSSKAAVFSLTQCAHKEYAEQGLRVIGLSPGTVATDMQKTIKASGVNPVSQLDWQDHIPAAWVAQAIAYLCGPGGNDFLGQDFSLKSNEGREAVGLPLIK